MCQPAAALPVILITGHLGPVKATFLNRLRATTARRFERARAGAVSTAGYIDEMVGIMAEGKHWQPTLFRSKPLIL